MNKYFNRLEYGRRLLAEPTKRHYGKEEIKAMAGFLITAMGQKPTVAKKMVMEKVRQSNKRASEKQLAELVSGIVKEVEVNGYEDVAPIEIYQNEIDEIMTAKTALQRTILFIYLCNLKYQRNLTGVNDGFYVTISKNRFHEGFGRPTSNKEVNQAIFGLRCQGLMSNKPGINETKGVLLSEPSGEVAFIVDDLRNLGTVLTAHTSKTRMRHSTLKKCACCSKPFIDSSTKNNTLYCADCRKLPQYKKKLDSKS